MQKKNEKPQSSFVGSVGFAFQGIRALATERNFRIHIAMSLATIALGLYLGLSIIEWCVISISIGLVLTAEAFNSALEQICNRVTNDHDPIIGKIKDISAAAVLILAASAVVVGILIFLPKII